MKKKDKKKFVRKDVNISNADISNLDDFIDDNVINQKKAVKSLSSKRKKSSKSNLDLITGRVIEVYSNYKCLVKIKDKNITCHVSGRLKHLRLETRNIISVGDWVKVDTKSKNRVEEIIKRKNFLVRYTEDRFQKKIIIASNIDNVIIITSCREPTLNLGMVDRLICAAKLSNINPVICINKTDLADDLDIIKQQADFYTKYGIDVIYCSAVTNQGIDKLKDILTDNDSVFAGHSGVGKSSLINILQPGLNLEVGEVSEYSKKGIHTTTRSKIISWKFGGNLIDTPGIKTLTLHEESKDEIKAVFPGFSDLSCYCHFQNCTHTHEKNCAVKFAVENNEFDSKRYESYLRILESFTGVKYD